MRNGEISYAKARVLVPSLTATNAAELIDIAASTPAGRLGAAIAAWSHRHEDPDLLAQRQRDARSCSWRTEPDGTVILTARLTPAAAGAVCAVIDTHVTRTQPKSVDPTPDNPADASADGTPMPGRHPSLAQQRADALVTIVTTPPGDNKTPAVQAEVVVHVAANGNTLTDGTPLSDHSVTAMLPDAFVSLLLHDTRRQPVDASPRRRFPTRRQRRIADARHPECAQPGCHASTFLEYDHIQPYTTAGPTTIANLQRLCGPHNRAKAAHPTPSAAASGHPS